MVADSSYFQVLHLVFERSFQIKNVFNLVLEVALIKSIPFPGIEIHQKINRVSSGGSGKGLLTLTI